MTVGSAAAVSPAPAIAASKPAAEAREASLQLPPAAKGGDSGSTAAAVAAAPLEAAAAPAPLQLRLVGICEHEEKLNWSGNA